MTRCSCGRMNGRGTVYCPGCGKTVNHVLCLAPNCGAQNPLDAQFCRVCGSDRLTEGADAKSFAFLPPLLLVAGGALVLTLLVTLLRTTVLMRFPASICRSALGLLRHMRCAAYEAASLFIIGSLVYLFLPEGGRKSVNALLKLWVNIGKVLSTAVGGFISWFVLLFLKKSVTKK